METLRQTINHLTRRERQSVREGYYGDAADHAFKRHVLERLEQLVKMGGKKKKPSGWNLFVGEYLKKGKTIKDAAMAWSKKK